MNFEWATIAVYDGVYKPGDDTWFLIGVLKERIIDCSKSLDLCMDLGCGTGVLGIYLIAHNVCKRVVFVDIDQRALLNTMYNLSLNNMLYKGLTMGCRARDLQLQGGVDLVVANPPYLPRDEYSEDPTVIGGRYGFESVIEFIDTAWRVLKENAPLFLVYSSLSHPEVIESHLSRLFNIVDRFSKKFFFEEIYVVEAVKK